MTTDTDNAAAANANQAQITITVNGAAHTLTVRHHWSLLDVLRDALQLTGAKRGCDRGECGSCTILLDGRPVNACQVLAMRAAGRTILTVEGLAVAGLTAEQSAAPGLTAPGLTAPKMMAPKMMAPNLPAADALSPLQQAFLDEDGGQCGFCTPGFVMAARALLNDNPTPSDAEIRAALSGNLCRCNAYGRILASVRNAAQRRA